VSATDVRIVFAAIGVTVARVNKRHMYFYVTLASAADASTALAYAQLPNFKIKTWDQPVVERRPLIGLTKFTSLRPFFVKDVCRATCVCNRCYKPKLMLKTLLAFKYWDIVCPAVAELIEDARNFAAPFSPSVDNLLDVILCARPAGGFCKKACCEGKCDQCGWDKLGVLSANDSIPASQPLPVQHSPSSDVESPVQFLNVDPEELDASADFAQGSFSSPCPVTL
jgi:hypothetical protein